jgi:SAM-dependent methyltransferase
MPEFALLPRVTSDCKPWAKGGELVVCEACGMIQKVPSDKWLREIQQIYEAYQLYHQADGAEQPIFAADGSSAPRSRLLVDYVAHRFRSHGLSGHLIDIGCGTGAALRNFSTVLPGWTLDGSELSDKALPSLRAIPGFNELYTVPLSEISQRYDVVTMIHSLEHIVDPAAILEGALGLLKPSGTLFIELPDIETSPFDLIIADHRSHFTRKTIKMLTARHGIATDLLENTVLPKEITFLGHKDGAAVISSEPTEGIRIVEQTIKWLHGTLAAATKASESPNFGIFGSSISAMWLYGPLRERVKFLVDEDMSRVGRRIDGKPILSPNEIPARSTIFVPLVKPIAAQVVRRLAPVSADFVLPPA